MKNTQKKSPVKLTEPFFLIFKRNTSYKPSKRVLYSLDFANSSFLASISLSAVSVLKSLGLISSAFKKNGKAFSNAARYSAFNPSTCLALAEIGRALYLATIYAALL